MASSPLATLLRSQGSGFLELGACLFDMVSLLGTWRLLSRVLTHSESCCGSPPKLAGFFSLIFLLGLKPSGPFRIKLQAFFFLLRTRHLHQADNEIYLLFPVSDPTCLCSVITSQGMSAEQHRASPAEDACGTVGACQVGSISLDIAQLSVAS